MTTAVTGVLMVIDLPTLFKYCTFFLCYPETPLKVHQICPVDMWFLGYVILLKILASVSECCNAAICNYRCATDGDETCDWKLEGNWLVAGQKVELFPN